MGAKLGTIRPHTWKSGPDPKVHEKYLPFLQARSQAAFRLEDWQLSWEDWLSLWPDHLWAKRGRKTDELALTRKDHLGPWSLENCHVVTRFQQLSEANRRRSRERRENLNGTRSKTKETS